MKDDAGPTAVIPSPVNARWRFERVICLRVIDGDTQVYRALIVVELPDGQVNIEKDFVVRLLGGDTPERGEPLWAEATARVKELWANRPVQFGEVMREGALQLTGRRDVYGRWLGWATLDGADLMGVLIAEGLAKPRAIVQQIEALAEEEE